MPTRGKIGQSSIRLVPLGRGVGVGIRRDRQDVVRTPLPHPQRKAVHVGEEPEANELLLNLGRARGFPEREDTVVVQIR